MKRIYIITILFLNLGFLLYSQNSVSNDYSFKNPFRIYDVDKYYVGYTNQYDHKVIVVIDLFRDVIYKVPLRKKVLRKLISFLHKIEKNI